MKRILLVITLVISVLALSACDNSNPEVEPITVIFFTANSGSTQVESYFNVTPNTKIEEPADPTRTGFIFDGWYKDFLLTQPWDFDTDTVDTKSIVLYASWIPGLHTITFDLNGGEFKDGAVIDTEFLSGESMVLPIPKRTGYIFISWYDYDWVDESSTKPGDPGFTTLPENTFEDVILYAHWESVSVTVQFHANYPEDGGPSNPSNITVYYGEIIDFDALADTDDYSFVGWNTRADGTGTFFNNGEIFERTQRTYLFAIWEAK